MVIPAYKPDYFSRVMDCLAGQTCGDFTVYIGDDASESDFESIVAAYRSKLDIVYRKFDENLGHSDLVLHWERCIRMSSEKWILLFSDDDMMPEDAIERCYKAVSEYPDREFFRFKMDIIDADDKCVRQAPEFTSRISSARDYLCEYMGMKRDSAVCEHFFSRRLFDEYGMVHFPMAWCSDIATWSMYAGACGMVNLDGKAFGWRNVQGVNISSDTHHDAPKVEALRLFMRWLRQTSFFDASDRELVRALFTYCKVVYLYSLRKNYTNRDLLGLCREVSSLSGICASRLFLRLIKWK